MNEAPRPGQKGALDTILARWERGESYTAIVAATRYGKSDIIRAATLLGVERRLITCSLVLSPTGLLVKQLVKADKWKSCLERFSADWLQDSGFPAVSFQPKYAQLRKLKIRPNSNGEHLLSATVQLINQNASIFCDWVESVRAQTGRPVAVFMDESHTGSESNSWGRTLKSLAREGALITLLTATAERSDGKPIPGFHFDEIDAGPVNVYVTHPGSEPELVKVDVYEGIKRKLRLLPDYEVPFRQAFDEDALAKVSHTTFDVDLREVAGESYSGMLSELPASRVAGALDKTVRHPDVIRAGCLELVTSLRRFRTTHPRTLAIIFCGNDDERHGASRGDNQHPKMIEAALRYVGPEFQPVIFSSLDDEAEDKLLAFCEGGCGDVAIVKQMGGLGLDSELLKVGLDLSTVRTFGASVQRMMRVATPMPLIAHWITPADLQSRANFTRIVTNEGGEAKSAELELIDSYEVERKEAKPKEVWRVGGVTPGDFDDSQQFHAGKDRYHVVQQFLASFPALRSQYTDAYIGHHLRDFDLTSAPGAPVAARDMSAEADAIRIEINEIADEATTDLIRARGLRYGTYKYGDVRKEPFVYAYGRAHWPADTELSQLDDVTLLIAVRDQLQDYRARILRGEL